MRGQNSEHMSVVEAVAWIVTRDSAFGKECRGKSALRFSIELAVWRMEGNSKKRSVPSALRLLRDKCSDGRVEATGLLNSGNRRKISPDKWIDLKISALTFNVERKGTGEREWNDVLFAASDMREQFPNKSVVSDPMPAQKTAEKVRSGAKELYDWDEGKRVAHREFQRRGDFNLPENADDGWRSQNDLVKLVKDALAKPGDKIPGDSTTKTYVSRWLKEWRGQ